jgi:hypothetical protein
MSALFKDLIHPLNLAEEALDFAVVESTTQRFKMRGIKSSLSLLTLLASTSLALPEPGCDGGNCPPPKPCHAGDCCLTGTVARSLADTYNSLFADLDASIALSILTEDFVYYADSDNAINPYVRRENPDTPEMSVW